MHNSNKKKCQKAPNAKMLFLIYYIFSTHRIFTFGFAGRVFTLSCMRPNFSRVRLTKIRGRTSATSRSRKEKKVSATQKVSMWFNKRHTLGLYRGLNQSEIVKGGSPLWLAVVQIFLYVCVRLQMRHVCCCSQTEREVSSRDARSVANLARFNAFVDPHSD